MGFDISPETPFCSMLQLGVGKLRGVEIFQGLCFLRLHLHTLVILVKKAPMRNFSQLRHIIVVELSFAAIVQFFSQRTGPLAASPYISKLPSLGCACQKAYLPLPPG